MPTVTYTALRELAPGHSVSTEYTIEFDVVKRNRVPKIDSSRQRSIGGKTKSVHSRTEIVYELTVSALAENSDKFNHFREFLGSVDRGESYILDPTGTVASPGTTYTCTLEGSGWGENRLELTDFFHFEFSSYVEPSE